jgi:ABC-type transport system substrate-binding protein
MEQQSREDSRVTEAAKIAGWLESLETPDDYTFTVTSATIDPVLCCDQGMDRGTWGMYLSKDYFDETGPQGLQDRMVGTGPYQFVEHVPGSYFLHEKVDYDHYRINPDFEEVQILTAIEPSTRLAMVLTGEAHLTLLPGELNAAAIAGGMEIVDAAFPSVLLTGVFGGNWIPDPDNPDDPYDPDNPFLNIKVREALNRAVDRKLIQDTILAGRGETQAVSLNGDEFARLTAPLHARLDAEYGFDPDRARELLVEAGYPNGFDTTMVLTPRVQLPGVEDVGEAIGNMWQDIGINVTFEDAEWQSYIIDIVTKKNNNEAAVLAVDWNQPIALYRLIYYSGGCCHIFDDAFLDEKFLALNVADDLAVRAQLFDDVYTHLFDQYATVPLFWVASQFVINPEVIAEYRTSGQRPPRHLEQIKAAR